MIMILQRFNLSLSLSFISLSHAQEHLKRALCELQEMALESMSKLALTYQGLKVCKTLMQCLGWQILKFESLCGITIFS